MQVTIARYVDQKCIAKVASDALQRWEHIKLKEGSSHPRQFVRHVASDMLGTLGPNC